MTSSTTPDAIEPRARTFDVVTVVWGPEFRQLFLDVCVPNQLTRGNLEALPPGSRYRVFTSSDDADVFERSPALCQVKQIMPVDIVVMPKLSARSKSRFTRMTACHRRALIDARETRSAAIFLCADHLLSEGALATVVRRHDAGSRAVLCTGVWVERDGFLAALRARDGIRALSAREMVSAALEHLHPSTRALMIDGERTARRPHNVYWDVPGEGLLVRCFDLHPLMVDPLRRNALPQETIDGHYVRHACPVRENVHVVSDSDELLVIEMSRADQAKVDTIPGGISVWKAAAMIARCDPHQESYWSQPIRFHARDIGEAWATVEEQSKRFADQAMRLRAARRWLTLRYVKLRWRRAAKPFSRRRLRRSVLLLTHAAARRVNRFRKRAARAGRRVLVG